MSRFINPFTFEEYQALVTGIPLHCPKAVFTVASQTFTSTQAVKFIGSVLSTVAATSAAKTDLAGARLAEEKAVAQDGATVKAIRENIASMFSTDPTTLAAFKIAPKKVRQPLSVAAKTAAAEKAKATRKARGTTSKKQKALISGNVTGVSITPITAPVATLAANPPAAPAAQAPSGSVALAPIQNPPVAIAPAPAPATAPSPAVTPVVSNPVTPASSGVVTPVPATGTSA